MRGFGTLLLLTLVAWSIANGGIASDMEVTVFLVASGVDWVRKGAAQAAHRLARMTAKRRTPP